MLKNKNLGEVFERQQKLVKIPDKVDNLRQNDTPGMRYILQLAHADVKWLLPEGAPPYKADPGTHGLTPSNLFRELRTLYLFLDGGNPTLTRLRREQLFVQLLERVHVSEAEMLIALKDKKFVNKYRCPKNVVEEAFPQLLEQPFQIRFIR